MNFLLFYLILAIILLAVSLLVYVDFQQRKKKH